MGGASSRQPQPDPKFVRNYESLVERDALPGAKQLFNELEKTFMEPADARSPSDHPAIATVDKIAALIKRIPETQAEPLRAQYVDKAERVYEHKIRDSFAAFVAYLNIQHVEIVVETVVNDYALKRVLTQLFTLRGALKTVKIVAESELSEEMDQLIRAVEDPDLFEGIETTPFYALIKKINPGALESEQALEWGPGITVKKEFTTKWTFTLKPRRQRPPKIDPDALLYDVDAEADKLNALVIASIEFFIVHTIFKQFMFVRLPIVARWWEKYIKFSHEKQADGSPTNDSLRKWARNVNAEIKSRGGRAVIVADNPYPRGLEPYTFGYQKELDDGGREYIGVLTLQKEAKPIVWDIEPRLTKIVDKFHAAFKLAVSRVSIDTFIPDFPFFGDVAEQWWTEHCTNPRQLAAELTRFCAENASNAPMLYGDGDGTSAPTRPVIRIEYDEYINQHRRGERKLRLHIFVDIQNWADIVIDIESPNRPFVLICQEAGVSALTHEIAYWLMQFEVDSIKTSIPFITDAFYDCLKGGKDFPRKITQFCTRRGSVALLAGSGKELIFEYYHGSTLVGKLDCSDYDTIRWIGRPEGWQTLKTTWRRFPVNQIAAQMENTAGKRGAEELGTESATFLDEVDDLNARFIAAFQFLTLAEFVDYLHHKPAVLRAWWGRYISTERGEIMIEAWITRVNAVLAQRGSLAEIKLHKKMENLYVHRGYPFYISLRLKGMHDFAIVHIGDAAVNIELKIEDFFIDEFANKIGDAICTCQFWHFYRNVELRRDIASAWFVKYTTPGTLGHLLMKRARDGPYQYYRVKDSYVSQTTAGDYVFHYIQVEKNGGVDENSMGTLTLTRKGDIPVTWEMGKKLLDEYRAMFVNTVAQSDMLLYKTFKYWREAYFFAEATSEATREASNAVGRAVGTYINDVLRNMGSDMRIRYIEQPVQRYWSPVNRYDYFKGDVYLGQLVASRYQEAPFVWEKAGAV